MAKNWVKLNKVNRSKFTKLVIRLRYTYVVRIRLSYTYVVRIRLS